YRAPDGSEQKLDMHGQQALYETSVGRLAVLKDYDVIHAHDWLTFRAGIRAKQATGRPLIVHVHSVEADRAGREGGGNPLVREIEEMGLTMADRIIAVSKFTKNAIVREYGIPESKIDVVHNSLDLEAV